MGNHCGFMGFGSKQWRIILMGGGRGAICDRVNSFFCVEVRCVDPLDLNFESSVHGTRDSASPLWNRNKQCSQLRVRVWQKAMKGRILAYSMWSL